MEESERCRVKGDMWRVRGERCRVTSRGLEAESFGATPGVVSRFLCA